MRLARVKGFDHLLLGLVKEILRNELTHLVVFGIIQLGRGPGQRSEVVQKDELGGRVLQGRGQELMI